MRLRRKRSNPPHVVRFAPDVVVRVIGNEALVLNLRKEQVFSLNDTGTRVAQLIAEGLTVETVIERLSSEYPQTTADVASAVHNLVGALIAKGLLVADVRDSE